MTSPIPENYLEFIHREMPDLKIHTTLFNQDGLVNDVVVVNRDWVFRFAKGEYGRMALAAELKVLDAIRPQAALPAPRPSSCSGPCWG